MTAAASVPNSKAARAAVGETLGGKAADMAAGGSVEETTKQTSKKGTSKGRKQVSEAEQERNEVLKDIQASLDLLP